MFPLIDQQGNLVSLTGFSSGLSVVGIIWSDQRPLVIVDDDIYGKGETIGPYTIVGIKRDGIVVADKSGEETWVPLNK
ncbi:MAG: hypothetical protein NC819_00600 [Candidatus Omnitrophica bacterium]|nr:hypothetical protein [Candidatus Omnitrophota bacterium]